MINSDDFEYNWHKKGDSMNYYIEGFKKFSDFKGRATRKEFWMFFLIHFIFVNVAVFFGRDVYTLYITVSIIPLLAISVRRLHDINKSGWWILINAIVFVGSIYMIVLLATDSQPGSNKYGDNPKDLN